MPSYRGHGLEVLPKPEKPAWARWLSRKRLGLLVGIGVILVIVIARFVASGRLAAHYQALATEVGSVPEFWSEVSPNHSGTGIVYQQSTETGVGVFFSPLPSGERKMVYELPEKFAIKERGAQNLNVWGWAPDDSLFAFSYLSGTNRLIAIHNGKTGEKERETKVSRQLKGFVWLDANAVAYVNERDDLYYWGAGTEKRGSSPVSFVKKGAQKPGIPVRGLTAVSPDTIAWHDGSAIWSWQFGTERPAKLWDGETNNIVDMGIAPGGNYFLLRLKESGGETIARVQLAGGRLETLARINALAQQTNKNHVVWLGGGFAHAWGGVATHSVFIYPQYQAKPQELVFPGGIMSYASSGSSLYLVGSRAGEPLGVWRYDGNMEKVTCVLSNALPRYRLAKPVTPEQSEFKTKGGTTINYWLWSPPKVAPGKKYPLLMGGPCWGWDSYRSAAVNGGAYVVNIDRDDWYSDWTEGVPELLEHLRESLKLDETKLYAFGTSAQVWHASRLVEEYPDTWRGVLMFSPGGSGPSFDKIKKHRLFIDCGADDRYTEGALKYRDEGLKRGIAITTMVHEDAEHTYRSIRSVRSRDQAVMRFLFGN